MNSRGRYPPGLAGGRGGNVVPNPNYQNRNYNNQQQQNYYGQRNSNNNVQQYQQQQWLRRDQLGADSSNDEVEKTVQSEAVDSGYDSLSVV